jgi:hypothetical protein
MKLPIRELILRALKKKFEDRDAGQEDSNHLVTWDRVQRTPIGDAAQHLRSIAAIIEGTETTFKLTGNVVQKNLDVSVDFEVRPFRGEEPSTFVNEVLADVQRTMQEDVRLGGLALNVQEIRNETDFSGDKEVFVGGTVDYEISYRHMLHDPSEPVGG